MRYVECLIGLLWATGASASYGRFTLFDSLVADHDAIIKQMDKLWALRDESGPLRGGVKEPKKRRNTYPISCHIHDWPSASVASVREAYGWFYQLWAPLEADAQQCRRVACFGSSGVWLCADSLGYKNINSVKIADKMNELLDGDNGCLDEGDKSMVQGMVFTSEEWSIVVRGGEDCSVDVPEQPIFY